MLRRSSVFVLVVVAVLGFAVSQASASTFANPSSIAIPGAAGETEGPAAPYPASIAVSDLPGTVADVNVTLNGFSHTCGSDVDILLVGPAGQKTILLSDAAIYNCVSDPPAPVTITLDDEAATTYPCNQHVSGTFKPTDNAFTGPMDNKCNESDNPFDPPAPAGPYPVALTALDGSPTNGTWNLFVFDHASGDSGTIGGGWSLDILPTVSCAGKAATVNANVGTAGSDTMVGTPGPDILIGLGGNDNINGLGGNDVICGGAGNDKLFGGPGKDLIRGEAGRDKLKGQGGKDTCIGGAKPDTAKSCEKEKSV